MIKLYFIPTFFIILLAGCKTAGKAYDKGNYTNAIELAVKKLQKNPNDGDAKALINAAYKNAVDEHENKIAILSRSSGEPKYEQIYNLYRDLQNLNSIIRQAPSLQGIVQPADYSEYLDTYKNKTGELYYEKGMAKMDLHDKAAYRDAYRNFQKALKFKENDSIRMKMDEAYRHAIVRIVVLPMNNNNYGYQYSNNSYQLRNFEESLVRNLRYSQNNEFVKFYSEWDARSENIEADEVLEMYLNRMEIGRPYDQHSTRNVSKEIVVKEIVYKPDSIVKQYARVSAQVTVTRRTMVSEGDLYITSRNARGMTLWTDLVRGEHRWQIEFASYRGDERALSDNDRALLNRYDYKTPREDEIMEAILRHIENQVQYRLRNHLNRYY